jgi:hypothetical protein
MANTLITRGPSTSYLLQLLLALLFGYGMLEAWIGRGLVAQANQVRADAEHSWFMAHGFAHFPLARLYQAPAYSTPLTAGLTHVAVAWACFAAFFLVASHMGVTTPGYWRRSALICGFLSLLSYAATLPLADLHLVGVLLLVASLLGALLADYRGWQRKKKTLPLEKPTDQRQLPPAG